MRFGLHVRGLGRALWRALPPIAASVVFALMSAAVVPGVAGAQPTAGNWDLAAQRQVVKAGLMSNISPRTFGGAQPLSGSQAHSSMAALARLLASSRSWSSGPLTALPVQPVPAAGQAASGSGQPASGSGSGQPASGSGSGQPASGSGSGQLASGSGSGEAVSGSGQPLQAPGQPLRPPRIQGSTLTVAGFDALLVAQLGLGDVARHVQAATAAAGLQPPPYFGTEVVARFMGLRYTHPVGSEQLALFPTDPVTRAEAAWSFSQVLANGSWSLANARSSLTGYQLPILSPDQLVALRVAVSRIGYPYVWGGTTDDTSDGLPHGGFDCSGFVWRVFKLSGLPWGAQILGRTAAQMAGEIPRRQRLRAGQLHPGDLVFFGTAGFHAAATEANIVHAGVYLGDNWVIHSSAQGVYLLPLKGSWLGDSFAWGRRVLPS
jgi:cell wall-associated NlpC family hydrolase